MDGLWGLESDPGKLRRLGMGRMSPIGRSAVVGRRFERAEPRPAGFERAQVDARLARSPVVR